MQLTGHLSRATVCVLWRIAASAAVLLLIAGFVLVGSGCGPERSRAIPDDRPAVADSAEAIALAEAAKAAAEAKRKAAEAEAARQREEAAKALAAAQKAENDLKLGHQAARAGIAKAAGWVGTVGFVTGLLSIGGLIVGGFFGGIGRSSALLGLGISAGCIWAQYFITSYGVLVSEAISWVVIIGLLIGAVGSVALLANRLWLLWNARSLAAKRAAQGEPARDAFALLPVSRSIKAKVDDAWNYLQTSGNLADPLSLSQAKQTLATYRLPEPSGRTPS